MLIRCVIPTHNRVDRLKLLLESFVRLKEFGGELPYAIDVIENGSKVAEKVVSGFVGSLPINYKQVSDGNKSAALNGIISIIDKSELVVFFDDDIRIVDANIFNRYRAAAEKYGEKYFYGGEVVPEFAVDPEKYIVSYMPKSNTGILFGDEKFKLLEGTVFLGCNWAVFSQQLKAINGFSSAFGPGSLSRARGQETDAQARLIENGLKPIAVSKTRVAHFVPAHAVTRKWILERRKLSARWYGSSFGSPVKALYWSIRYLIEYPISFRMSSAIRCARFKGFLEGYQLQKDDKI